MYHQISRNKRNSIIVIAGFLAVWLVAGLIIGWLAYGQGGAVAGAIVLGLLGVAAALYAYYFGSATVLAAMGAQPADPHQYQQLHNIVQALAIGDGLPLPKVYVINDPSPNAFATGRDPNHAAVTVTTGLLQMMNREELEGVLAHEMSHIKNFDVRLLLVVATMIGMAALIASAFWNSVGRMRPADLIAAAGKRRFRLSSPRSFTSGAPSSGARCRWPALRSSSAGRCTRRSAPPSRSSSIKPGRMPIRSSSSCWRWPSGPWMLCRARLADGLASVARFGSTSSRTQSRRSASSSHTPSAKTRLSPSRRTSFTPSRSSL